MAAFAATPASATVLSEQGGLGGGHFWFDCKSPHPYLNGFAIRSGLWLDQIQPVCHSFSPEGRVNGGSFGPKFGGEGGGPRTETCNANSVLTGVRVVIKYKGVSITPEFVQWVELICTSLLDGSRSRICTAGGVCPRTISEGTHCPHGEAATGIRGRHGKFVDAIGLVCGPAPKVVSAPPPVATTPPPPKPIGAAGSGASNQETMDCRGGGGMAVTPLSEGKSVYISFTPGANAANLRPGECAWVNRAFKQEGRRLSLMLSVDRAQEVLAAARSGGAFTVRATPIGTSFIMASSVANVRGGGAQPSPTPGPAPMPVPGGGSASGSCPGGTATVVIPEPHLDRLNVRTEPNGPVITGPNGAPVAVPRGGTVSVIGPCGGAGGAGLRAGVRAVVNTPGWCQIQSPVAGCVMSQYLQFGGGQLPDGAAGFRRQR